MADLDYAKHIFSVRELIVFGLAFIVFALCLQVILFLIYGLFYDCYCTVACINLHYKECLGEENYSDAFQNRGSMDYMDRELDNNDYKIINESEIQYFLNQNLSLSK